MKHVKIYLDETQEKLFLIIIESLSHSFTLSAQNIFAK